MVICGDRLLWMVIDRIIDYYRLYMVIRVQMGSIGKNTCCIVTKKMRSKLSKKILYKWYHQ